MTLYILQNLLYNNNLMLKLAISLLALFAVIRQSKCNFWDNIFSQTEATSPIILSQSISFKFPVSYQNIEMQAAVDFNFPDKIFTVIISKPLPGFKFQVIRAQLELSQFLLTGNSVLRGCQKYKLVLNDTEQGIVQKVDLKSKIFLVNLLFQFQQRSKNDKSMNQYILRPDLLNQHTEDHQQYQFNPLLVVDKNGSIVKIYQDKDKKKEVPFLLKSVAGKKLECKSETKLITKQQLYKMISEGIEDIDLQKILGLEKGKLPNIPKIPDFDFSKLPRL